MKTRELNEDELKSTDGGRSDNSSNGGGILGIGILNGLLGGSDDDGGNDSGNSSISGGSGSGHNSGSRNGDSGGLLGL